MKTDITEGFVVTYLSVYVNSDNDVCTNIEDTLTDIVRVHLLLVVLYYSLYRMKRAKIPLCMQI